MADNYAKHVPWKLRDGMPIKITRHLILGGAKVEDPPSNTCDGVSLFVPLERERKITGDSFPSIQ